jgi:hypothetical protein
MFLQHCFGCVQPWKSGKCVANSGQCQQFNFAADLDFIFKIIKINFRAVVLFKALGWIGNCCKTHGGLPPP